MNLAIKYLELTKSNQSCKPMPPKTNRKCSVEGCNKKHQAKGFCKNHYMKNLRTNPEWKDDKNKKDLERYYKNYEENKAIKRKIGKSIQSEIVTILGGKCVSCDEKFNPGLSSSSNLHIHHKFYSDKDKTDLKRIGVTGHHWEIKRLIKNNQINELKKKFTLLCRECNQMEKFAKKNGQKTFDFFCWLYGENYFDQALKDDPKLKKLSEFMK